MNENDTPGNLPQETEGQIERSHFNIIGIILIAITPALLLVLILCENTGRSAHAVIARGNIIDLDARRKLPKKNDNDAGNDSVIDSRPQLHLLSNQSENARAASAYTLSGHSYGTCGEWRKALGDYLMAVSIDPTPERYSHCAQMYTKLGDYDNAINCFARAIGTKPDSGDLDITYTALDPSAPEDL